MILAGICALPVCAYSAAAPDTTSTAYDIPTSELNKVKKKTPAKRTAQESKKKKKGEGTVSQTSESAAPSATDGQRKADNGEVQKRALSSKSPTATENIQIHHAPYSFVVADKAITIHAVVNSKSDIQEIFCSIPTTDGVAFNHVAMGKMTGTRFTYTATLPGVPLELKQLLYTIVVVDTQGTVARSQEFATPVTSSQVVPSWQQPTTGTATLVEQNSDQKKE
jgi:hypothetical protein